MTDAPLDLIAACAFGLEAIVRRELAELEIDAHIGAPGRVHFRGDWETIATANIWLRTADRVLLRVAEFPAADFDALFEGTRSLPWGRFIPADAAFPVTGRSVKSQLSSVPACQRSVKRAVVDALQRDHSSETLPETGAEYKIDIALLKDIATLTIDTTGRSLHRRGYRTHISGAPLKETLASALVLLSYWRAGKPFLDPFCGSGTIPIEAARIGRRLAPGKDRQFAAEAWSNASPDLWHDTRTAAAAQVLDPLEERLLASDIDPNAIRAARENATRAGVIDDIHFQVKDLQAVTSKRRFGCLITNPPYGVRLEAGGEADRLEDVYSALPEMLRKLPTWSHYFLTAYPAFERVVGRSADRRRKLYNGRIECTYFQFHGPKPVVDPVSDEQTSGEPYVHAVGKPAFGHLDAKAHEQAELFAARLRKRARHFRRWPSRRGITCYRIYERDIPEIPLIVDRYEQFLHITEYERPHERDPAAHANWLELMAETAARTLDVRPADTFLKRRQRQRGRSQHEKLSDTQTLDEVGEGGLRFLVNLRDYVDTGLFLDHRVTRGMVRDQASETTFLNLFAYTGAFTVYAAAGGAARTVSVDLSRRYLAWAERNLQLNGLDGSQHEFVAADAATFVREHRPGEIYDLVVVDPPTFSNSARTDRDWDIQRDAIPLLTNLLPLVRSGGVIFFSSNFRRFKFDAAQIPAREVHEISRQSVPEDFRNRRIHRCWRLVK